MERRGWKQDWAEGKDVVSIEASAGPVYSSEAGMTLQICHELKYRGQAFIAPR